jgi:hypothetical protein
VDQVLYSIITKKKIKLRLGVESYVNVSWGLMPMHYIFGPLVNLCCVVLSDVLNGSFYGEIDCDTDHLNSYFSEMQPIFKNVDISFNNLSSDTQKQVKPNYQSKKLIGSFFGKKVLIIKDVLQWYLQKGLIVSNITYAVRYEKKAPFKSFVNTVSNAR